jgi:hypothetical protein
VVTKNCISLVAKVGVKANSARRCSFLIGFVFCFALHEFGEACGKPPSPLQPNNHQRPRGLASSQADERDNYRDEFFPITESSESATPLAVQKSYQIGAGGVLTVEPMQGLLHDGSSQASFMATQGMGHLRIASVEGWTSGSYLTTAGTLTWRDDGSFTYRPVVGYGGTENFSYVVTDGVGRSSLATFKVDILYFPFILRNDANGDGVIDSADEPINGTGSGPIILTSNGSEDPFSTADIHHMDEQQMTIDPNHSFASMPHDLTGWRLNFHAARDASAVHIWDSTGKISELENGGQANHTWAFASFLCSGDVPPAVWISLDQSVQAQLTLELQRPIGSLATFSPQGKPRPRP